MPVEELIEIAQRLGVTPEELETLTASERCSECEHRWAMHDADQGYCCVNGCHCQI